MALRSLLLCGVLGLLLLAPSPALSAASSLSMGWASSTPSPSLLSLSHASSSLSSPSPAFSVYSSPASPPSFLAPARLHCPLLSVDGGNHRALQLQLGSPAQTLRLLIDTGSADLWVLNSSYCTSTQSTNSHSCFNPTNSAQSVLPTLVTPTAFKVGTIVDDGEPLSDVAAHAAQAVANLPLQLQGSNVTVLLGAGDVTLQDSLLGYPTASTQRVSLLLSSPTTVFTPPIPTLTFAYPISSSYNSLQDIDGLLGVAYNPLGSLVQLYPTVYPTTAFLQMTQAIATQPLATTFALDFHVNHAYFGGIDEHWRDALVWSYPGSEGVEWYHSFLMFDLSVCGVNLQQGVLPSASQPLNAVVDSGSSCLALPLELFDALVTWLPVTCSDSADGQQLGASTSSSLSDVLGGNVYPPVNGRSASPPSINSASASNINPHVRYCWLAADLLVDMLPTLSFRLSASDPSLPDDDPTQPVRLLLPLADLILGTARSSFASQVTPQRLCLYRDDSVQAGAPVTIGGRSLASLHVAFAMDSHQLGLANQPDVLPSDATCVRPVHCVGQQTHDPVYNLCSDPHCSSYYLFTLDAQAHSCQLSPAFHVLGALAIALFIAVEVGLNEYIIELSARVQGIGQQHSHSHNAQHSRGARRRSHRR